MSPETVTLNVTETVLFTATAYDQYGVEMPEIIFAWTSSNETVGTIDAAGLFTALAPGTTTVTATNGTVSGTAEVMVTYVPEVTTIEVSPETVTLNVTETVLFTATAYDQYGGLMEGINITWMSTNTTVGPVSPEYAITDVDGTATTTFSALANGTTTIRGGNLTAEGWVFDEATVTVSLPPSVLTNITVSPPEATLNVTETRQFTATARDQYKEVMPEVVFTWVSLNETVGTIDDTGLFTALARGTTTVGAYNASVGPSINGKASVTVSKLMYTIELVTGYNMISMPLNDTSVTNASSLIDKIGADCTEVSKWDKDTQGWKAYAPGQPAIFDFDIGGGEGCFVSMSGPATVVFTGMGWTSPFTISLVTGYDMIGIPVNDTSVTNASSLIDKIGVDCTEVSKWDKDTQGWKAYAPGQPSIFDFDIGGGEGCFVSMADDAEVTFEGEPWSD